jgi:hypothetical protein
MDEKTFLRVARALIERYADDTWIDYDIVPSILICLFKEFPAVSRKVALDTLDRKPPCGWRKERRCKVDEYFGPRFFVALDPTPNNKKRLYWQMGDRHPVSFRKNWKDATRFDSEEEAKRSMEREGLVASGRLSVVSVAYPAWTQCKGGGQ